MVDESWYKGNPFFWGEEPPNIIFSMLSDMDEELLFRADGVLVKAYPEPPPRLLALVLSFLEDIHANMRTLITSMAKSMYGTIVVELEGEVDSSSNTSATGGVCWWTFLWLCWSLPILSKLAK